jgi:hypothetical protein
MIDDPQLRVYTGTQKRVGNERDARDLITPIVSANYVGMTQQSHVTTFEHPLRHHSHKQTTYCTVQSVSYFWPGLGSPHDRAKPGHGFYLLFGAPVNDQHDQNC